LSAFAAAITSSSERNSLDGGTTRTIGGPPI
jgi:hypothetical protein